MAMDAGKPASWLERLLVLLDWSVLRYLTVGVANTFVGLGTIFACKWFLGLSDVIANAIGYAFGLSLSFLLNKRWTFQFDGAHLPALLRFLGVIMVAYLANVATLLLLIWAGVDSYLAQTLAVAPYTIIGYVGSRYIAFPDQRG